MKYTIIIAIIFLSGCLISQTTPYYSRVGGDGDDIAYSGKATLDKSYIICGSSSSYGTHGSTDVFLVKLDVFGFPKWQRFYGGPGQDVGKSLLLLPDSGYILTGFTNSYGAGGYDAFIIRIDKEGEIVWEKTVGGENWDFGNDAVIGADGKLYVVGHTESFGAGRKDGFLAKFDLNGSLLWNKFFGGTGEEELRSIIQTNDGNLAVVGSSQIKDPLGNCWFLKITHDGDTVFTKELGGPFLDYANDIVQKDIGDFVIVGAKSYSLEAPVRSYLHRMTSTGTAVMDTCFYSTDGRDEITSVCNSTHRSFLTAFTRVPKFSSKGLQEQTYVIFPNGYEFMINDSGEEMDESVHSVEATPDGGLLSVGSTMSFGSMGRDVYFIKRDSVGSPYKNVMSVDINKTDRETSYIFTNRNELFFRIPKMETVRLVEIWDIQGSLIFSAVPNENKLILTDCLRNQPLLVKINFNSGKFVTQKFLTLH